MGKGERKAYLQGIAEQFGGGVVEFHEQQPKEDIMAALSLASAGYISLKFQPLFRFGISPNKLWDYMLAGLPVILLAKLEMTQWVTMAVAYPLILSAQSKLQTR